MDKITDKELGREFTREMTKLGQQGVVIRLSLTPDQAMALIAAVQLANRHPFNVGPSRLLARRMVDRMQSEFGQYKVPHVIEVIQRGWNDQYDIEKGDQP